MYTFLKITLGKHTQRVACGARSHAPSRPRSSPAHTVVDDDDDDVVIVAASPRRIERTRKSCFCVCVSAHRHHPLPFSPPPSARPPPPHNSPARTLSAYADPESVPTLADHISHSHSHTRQSALATLPVPVPAKLHTMPPNNHPLHRPKHHPPTRPPTHHHHHHQAVKLPRGMPATMLVQTVAMRACVCVCMPTFRVGSGGLPPSPVPRPKTARACVRPAFDTVMATHLRMGQWGSPNENGTNAVIGSVRTVGWAVCSAGGVVGGGGAFARRLSLTPTATALSV